MLRATLAATAAFFILTSAHAGELKVIGQDQDMTSGTVTADKINAGENGWMVVHRIKENGKPGPVVGHAPLKAGENTNISAILTGKVEKGEKVMLMLHAEQGGTQTGIFEYTLGAKEDGPIKVDGNLVMTVVKAL